MRMVPAEAGIGPVPPPPLTFPPFALVRPDVLDAAPVPLPPPPPRDVTVVVAVLPAVCCPALADADLPFAWVVWGVALAVVLAFADFFLSCLSGLSLC